MTTPCNRPYNRVPLDRHFLADELGLDEYVLSVRLHKLKRLGGLRGNDAVTICLDDAEVYAAHSCDHIGSLHG